MDLDVRRAAAERVPTCCLRGNGVKQAGRKLDTVACVQTPTIVMNMTQDANGRMSVTSIINPMQSRQLQGRADRPGAGTGRARDYRI